MAIQSLIPRWARIPSYVQARDVVATNKGWKLKASGELLVSFHNLADKLKQLQDEINVSIENIEKKSDKPKQQVQVKPETVVVKPETEPSNLPNENTIKKDDSTVEKIVKEPTEADLEALASENDTEDEDDKIGALSIAPLSAESISLEVGDALKEAAKNKESKKTTNKRKPRK